MGALTDLRGQGRAGRIFTWRRGRKAALGVGLVLCFFSPCSCRSHHLSPSVVVRVTDRSLFASLIVCLTHLCQICQTRPGTARDEMAGWVCRPWPLLFPLFPGPWKSLHGYVSIFRSGGGSSGTAKGECLTTLIVTGCVARLRCNEQR